MKATNLTEFTRIEESDYKKKTEDHDFVEHTLDGTHPYEIIHPYKSVEALSYDQTINFIAIDPGFYRIVFSNEHSWYRAKELLWRYCVLKPTDHLPIGKAKHSNIPVEVKAPEKA